MATATLSYHRRRVVLLPVIAVVAFGAFLTWLCLTGYRANEHLTDVQNQIVQIQKDIDSNRLDGLSAELADVRSQAGKAHRLTSGPTWRLAARMPLMGPTAASVTGLAAASDDFASTALPQLIAAATSLADSGSAGQDGTVDLGLLAQASHHLDLGQAAVTSIRGRLAMLPSTGVVDSVAAARRSVDDQLQALMNRLDQERRQAEAQVAPPAG